ncbi:uncharacterized protein LOC117341971 [Pecten maximus]|uniref:uncharacterized protein LOC117341971 n=1 Tax=Pecten maximus TaxID=6579 RepID=UPI00145879C3|nr:uncharacterized protein LOC117341971 [Pecten maximus]XP_033759764.1 uncharacterized protein LOC117341971 [Pecten maximus]
MVPLINNNARANEQFNSILVIYTEADRKFYKDVLQTTLEERGIKCRTLEDDGLPSNTIFTNFESLLAENNKLLFILSNSFKQDKIVLHLAVMAAAKSPLENTVCVIRGEEIRFEGDINYLQSAPSVMVEAEDWKTELASALHYTTPPFCHYIGTTYETRGLTLRDMRIDLYGLAVEINNRCLRIDVKEFEQYFSSHKNCETTRIFGEYMPLYTDKTSVSLYYRQNLNDMDNYDEFVDILSRLCGDVFNISAARKEKIMTTLGTTLEGPIRDLECIRRIWLRVFYKDMKQKESSVEMKHPSFQNRDKRVQTFPKSWSESGLPKAEDMAEAGLFFAAPPHVATCFMCGYTMFNWRDDDVPWEAHAAINKECPYINDVKRAEEIERALESYTEGEFVVNERYKSVEARKGTFATFNLDNLTKYRKESENPFADREELIEKVSEAGFYFAGSDDLFSCYACGLMLSCISKKIMATHAKFSPECPHVLSTKGRGYVEDVSANNDDPSIVTFSLRKFDDNMITNRDIVMSTAVRSRNAGPSNRFQRYDDVLKAKCEDIPFSCFFIFFALLLLLSSFFCKI